MEITHSFIFFGRITIARRLLKSTIPGCLAFDLPATCWRTGGIDKIVFICKLRKIFKNLKNKICMKEKYLWLVVAIILSIGAVAVFIERFIKFLSMKKELRETKKQLLEYQLGKAVELKDVETYNEIYGIYNEYHRCRGVWEGEILEMVAERLIISIKKKKTVEEILDVFRGYRKIDPSDWSAAVVPIHDIIVEKNKSEKFIERIVVTNFNDLIAEESNGGLLKLITSLDHKSLKDFFLEEKFIKMMRRVGVGRLETFFLVSVAPEKNQEPQET